MKLGFIGLGNMASAILRGVLAAGLVTPADVCGSCAHADHAAARAKEFGIAVNTDNTAVVEASDIVFLSCKPQQYEAVLVEIREAFTADANKILITIAPGKTLAWVEQQLAGATPPRTGEQPARQVDTPTRTGEVSARQVDTPTRTGELSARQVEPSLRTGELPARLSRKARPYEVAKIVRCMPNTPALVGEGLTSYCSNAQVTPADLAQVEALLDCIGKRVQLPEEKIDAASAVGGSAPAFVYAFIEALADGGVAEGLPRAQAYEIAAQTVLGSAKMVLETGEHPAALKDAVCSPGGTTIKGLESLERDGFRGAVINAVRTTTAAAREM